MRRFAGWLLPAAAGALGLMLWVGVKAWWALPDFILPGPDDLWRAFLEERELLLRGSLTTLASAAIGFLAAATLGFALALALSLSRWSRLALYPYVLLLQMIPVVVLAPVFVLWLGPDLPSVSLISFLIGFFPVAAVTTQGLVSTDAASVELFRSWRATRFQEYRHLRIPHALPYYLAGLRVAGSLAMIGAIAGEFYAGSASGGSGGLGFLVMLYSARLKVPALFAAGLTACLCGLIFVSAVVGLQWLLLRKWHESALRAER